LDDLQRGSECDILEAGGWILPDDCLATGAIGCSRVFTSARTTSRSDHRSDSRAIENPLLTASRTDGRIINVAKPYDVDMDAVMKAAKQHGKFLELKPTTARWISTTCSIFADAKRLGIPIVINHRRALISTTSA